MVTIVFAYSLCLVSYQPLLALGLRVIEGLAEQAQFQNPTSIIIRPDGGMYVADTGNECVRHITKEGMVSTIDHTLWRTGVFPLGTTVTLAALTSSTASPEAKRSALHDYAAVQSTSALKAGPPLCLCFTPGSNPTHVFMVDGTSRIWYLYIESHPHSYSQVEARPHSVAKKLPKGEEKKDVEAKKGEEKEVKGEDYKARYESLQLECDAALKAQVQQCDALKAQVNHWKEQAIRAWQSMIEVAREGAERKSQYDTAQHINQSTTTGTPSAVTSSAATPPPGPPLGSTTSIVATTISPGAPLAGPPALASMTSIVAKAIATVTAVKEEKAPPSSKRQGAAAVAQRHVRSRPSPPSSPPLSLPPLETYLLAPPVPPPTPPTTRIQKI